MRAPDLPLDEARGGQNGVHEAQAEWGAVRKRFFSDERSAHRDLTLIELSRHLGPASFALQGEVDAAR
jgi:hypothetical protein